MQPRHWSILIQKSQIISWFCSTLKKLSSGCKLEKARAKQELTKREEYSFFVETFRKGMVCKYGEKNDNLVRVSLESDQSIKISISEEMKTKENSEHLLGVLIESMSSSFLTNYLKAMDIVEEDSEIEDKMRKIKKRIKDKS